MEFSNYLKIKNKLPSNVNLLAVSKGFPAEQIKIIHDLGQNDFGESKFQEFYEKKKLLKEIKSLKWHFIGRIQSNKIRKIVQNFEYIHSVDSYEKLLKISNVAIEENRIPSVLIQVKLSDDPSKGGLHSEVLNDKWNQIKQLKHIKIKGLMTINPKGLSSADNFDLFAKCRSLADALELPDCSMGMSEDWEQAVDAGATWIRLGSMIFGNRFS